MQIKNDKIKKLLEEKKEIVEKAQRLNRELDKKAEIFVSGILKEKGIDVVGEEEIAETKTERAHTVKLFSGSYQKLRAVFATESMADINEQIESHLEKELAEVKSLEYQVNKINEQVTKIIDKEKLDLGEFEVPGQIKLVDDIIDIEIINLVEEFKTRYRNR